MPFPTRPICVDCKRLHALDAADPGWRCEAFPDGIPQAIIDSTLDHREPVAGDHDLQFLARSAHAAADAAHIIAEAQRHPGGIDPWQRNR